MEYMTMICDIKNSKMLKNRESVQYALIKTIKEANECFSSIIASPFLIILGDEWQGLLNYPCDYEAILEFFHKNMDNIDFYCGIGIGEILIHNFELTVNQLDGPSFYKARKAIKIAKQYNYKIVCIQLKNQKPTLSTVYEKVGNYLCELHCGAGMASPLH